MKRLSLLLLTLVCVITAQAQKKNRLTLSNLTVTDVPSVEWMNYSKDTTIVSQNVQTLSSKIHSRLRLVSAELKVNNNLEDQLNSADFSKAIEENKYEQLLEKTITLRTGFNTIVITTKNIKGLTNVSTRIVKVDPTLISTLRNEKDQNAPMIYVSNPNNIREDNRVVVYDDLVRLTGTVIDESGIQSLNINNIKTPVKENGAFVIQLPLNVGENPITIEVKDINQNIALKKFIIDRKNMDGTVYSASEAKNYLLLIGINSYKSWPALNNAVSDIDEIKKVLTKNYNFDSTRISVLVNENATRAKIYDALRQYIEKISPGDNLMIYYSGHGYFDKLLNEGYWVPVDAEKNDVSGYVPNSQILKIIENINSQHTFLVADACFSGSLFASTSRGYSEHVEKYKSRWGLVSGRLEEVSDGVQGTNSPFAQGFIEFLTKATGDKVPVSDLVQYVKKKVSETTDQTPLGNPLKGVGDEGGEFIFYKKL